MKSPWKQLLAALAVCLPLVTFAQTPAAEPAKPADTAAPAPAPAPAPAAKPDEGPKVSFYGFILANMFFDGGTFATKDYPGAAVLSPNGAGGATLFSARQSRLGVKVATKDTALTGAELVGTFEFDFKAGWVPTSATCSAVPAGGGTPTCTIGAANTASTGFYNGLMRLRLANMTASWKTPAGNVQVLAGQAYGIVNTLFAESLAWVADPIFWQAGNLWRRSPQLRLGWNNTFDVVNIGVEVAALSPADAPPAGSVPGAGADYGAGNRSRSPELEARLQATVKPMAGVSAVVGAAVNRARRTYDTGTSKKSLNPSAFGLDFDVNVPYAQLKGEYYTMKGEDDSYNGPTAVLTGAAGARELVKSSGYWAQLILKPTSAVWAYAGTGQGKGDDASLAKVAAASRTATRAKNKQLALGVLVNAGKNWRFGLEWEKTTTYLGATTADSNVDRDASQIAISSQLRF